MAEYLEYTIYPAPAQKPGLRGNWKGYPEWKDAVEKTLDPLKTMEKEKKWLKPKTEQEIKESQSALEKIVEKLRESLAPFMDERFPNSCREALRIAKGTAGPHISTFMWAEVAGPAFSKTEKLVREIAGKNGLDKAAANEIAMEAADIAAWSIAWPILELQRISGKELKKTLVSYNPFAPLLSLYKLGAARIGFEQTEQGEKIFVDFLVKEEGKTNLKRYLF